MKNKKITDILKGVREHVVMRDYTTLHIGGVADYFFEAKTIDDLIKAVRTAVDLKIPYFILGNGSNILFSDYGFAGLVIKNATTNISIMKEKSQVIVDAGVMLPRLIMALASDDLAGLEFLYGVPGTVGGALYGNAGAWGNAISDYLKNLTVLEKDSESGIPKVSQYSASWLDFTYRSSKLKRLKSKEKPVILTAQFQLARSQKEEIIRRLNVIQKKRQATQPIGLSAGSIFRNPIPKELKNISGTGTKNMPEFAKERTAGFMLEQVGAKKLKVGSAEVSGLHANFILNKNGAKGAEIRSLIEEIRDKVNEKFGIVLEEEIEYIGQW
ncbi:MAG: UDP-N-acetylenolpyruvoylglucosamine reductase [Berkelbacteria bacterium GW2011_GWA1_36_9]|uniref:UDP-N-acetylenolpyruvoylglucosamine reductase n=1 Tax=Berkelbacteria bacterium GW2011_GWA1_36_9 TaxID=1618331 RepID=A0A0G0FYJ5_9BACT|nr:MAG: UDP-N-acetylenolpyruvoylglucosamine reductase [Berkelbacteria bacterium GW2011_GWA1_36_9]